MSEIPKLNTYLKPQEYFGLQFFALSYLNEKSKVKFTSTMYIISFIIRIVLNLYGYIFSGLFYGTIKNISMTENLLGFTLEIVVTFFTAAKVLFGIIEAFVKVKSNQKFFILLHKFESFLVQNMNSRLHFGDFWIIQKYRMIFIGVVLTSFSLSIGIPMTKASRLFLFLGLFVNMLGFCLILFKICFYVDIVGVCLRNFHESLERISINVHNEQIMVRNIYQSKRLYIYIIKMTKQLNNFMSITIYLFMVSQTLYLSLRFYHLLLNDFCDLMRTIDILLSLVFGHTISSVQIISCQRIEKFKQEIIEKISEIDDEIIGSLEGQKVLNSIYKQMKMQPVEITICGATKISKAYFAGVVFELKSRHDF
ncbi:hypothetical protein ACKWTF_016408 [Chironomus riparius]